MSESTKIHKLIGGLLLYQLESRIENYSTITFTHVIIYYLVDKF